jgi:hypothetical protein
VTTSADPDDLHEALNAASGGLDEALQAAHGAAPRPSGDVPIITVPPAPWWRRKIWRVDVLTLIFTAIGAVAAIVVPLYLAGADSPAGGSPSNRPTSVSPDPSATVTPSGSAASPRAS